MSSIQVPSMVRICGVCNSVVCDEQKCAECERIRQDALQSAADAVEHGVLRACFDGDCGWNGGIGKLWREAFEAEFRRLRRARSLRKLPNLIGRKGSDLQMAFRSRSSLRTLIITGAIGGTLMGILIALAIVGVLKMAELR